MRSTHLGWGTQHTHSSALGPPCIETPTEPDRRRRTAAEFAVDRPRSILFPPLRSQVTPSAPSLPGWWARATAPSPPPLPRSWAGWAASAPAPAPARRVGRNSPLAQLDGEFLFFFSSYFLFSFSHIYLDANILCTKNRLNKLLGQKNNEV
jgi:hypothetical protein